MKPAKKAATKSALPKSLADQARAVRSALQSQGKPATAAELARTFQGAGADKVQDLLEALRRWARRGRWKTDASRPNGRWATGSWRRASAHGTRRTQSFPGERPE